MKLGDYVTLGVIALIIGAVILGRRKGQRAAAAALAAAFSKGEAHARAEAAAVSSSRVDLGGLHFGGAANYGTGNEQLDAIADAVLARLSATNRPGDYGTLDNDHDNGVRGLPVRDHARGVVARVGRSVMSSSPRRGTTPLFADVGIVVDPLTGHRVTGDHGDTETVDVAAS